MTTTSLSEEEEEQYMDPSEQRLDSNYSAQNKDELSPTYQNPDYQFFPPNPQSSEPGAYYSIEDNAYVPMTGNNRNGAGLVGASSAPHVTSNGASAAAALNTGVASNNRGSDGAADWYENEKQFQKEEDSSCHRDIVFVIIIVFLTSALVACVTAIAILTSSTSTSITTSTTRKEESRYFLSLSKMNWTDAKKYCEKGGAYLVAIETEEEDKRVAEEVIKFGLRTFPWWIGAKRDENGDKDQWQWFWRKGEEKQRVNYTNWFKGQPNNYEGRQTTMCLWTRDLEWNDCTDTDLYNVICEFTADTNQEYFAKKRRREYERWEECDRKRTESSQSG